MRSFVVAATLLATALSGSTTALANGRPPVTNGLYFRPGDDHSLYVATTFGLLISHDDGCSFRWVCEQNLGYGGTFDPKYRIAADGAIFATTFTGLRVSRDGGCSFSSATADLPAGADNRLVDRWIDAIDIGPTGDVWVATADSGRPNDIYRSTDNGRTFASRGMLSQAIWWKSLAIAPSRAQRVYATGYQVAGTAPDGSALPPTAHFEITDDNGEHWTASPMTGVQFGATPLVYAVGVDRANPDIVFMSSLGANPPNGDRLYRSSDGGMTWTEVLAVPSGNILDLATAPTGEVRVATFGGGAFESTDRGATFAAMENPPQLACIEQRDDGRIYGCGANWEPDDKAVAESTDGKTWSKLFRFVELAGPVDCPAGTPETDTCGSLWPSVAQQFGVTGAPMCGVPPIEAPVPRQGGGCCEAGDASPGQLGALGMLTVVGGAVGLRRRRGQ